MTKCKRVIKVWRRLFLHVTSTFDDFLVCSFQHYECQRTSLADGFHWFTLYFVTAQLVSRSVIRLVRPSGTSCGIALSYNQIMWTVCFRRKVYFNPRSGTVGLSIFTGVRGECWLGVHIRSETRCTDCHCRRSQHTDLNWITCSVCMLPVYCTCTSCYLLTTCVCLCVQKYCRDETGYPDRLFACLVKQKEDHEREGSEFDERCSRVLVQRLRVRALGVCVMSCRCL